MIRRLENVFVLDTAHTTYCFGVMDTGQLEHLHYGEKIGIREPEQAKILREKHAFAPGNTIIYDPGHPQYSLENMRLEMSSYGKGDIREPFIEVVHEDGSFTSDFRFRNAEIFDGKRSFETLPGSYEENGRVQELVVYLEDEKDSLTLELHYFVFEDRDVISRSARFCNTGTTTVRLNRLLSTQIDFIGDDFIFTTFTGCWGREMKRTDTPARAGRLVNSSYTGSSSSRANPFVMLSKKNTGEDFGPCYGLNLIYSGNHYEVVEVSPYHKTRYAAGINPQSFSFIVEPGACFEAPEAVMTYSECGYNGMSQIMHSFVRECICRGKWKDRTRPVLLNSWEASYFAISQSRLLRLAKAGRDVGIELFVMDDGWFGERNDDSHSLGDWTPNPEKLPDGLDGFARKINELGLEFGIWVEPEMVNTESRLYREHPGWTMEIPGRAHSEGRNQRILDLANPEVVDYMTDAMRKVFSSANIRYVKWDMNRTFLDYYSPFLPPEKQGETAHRYIMGLYRMMKTLTEEFPDILFEGCAAGGNRFDLGILSYFPQIWASDDTDALYRVNGQTSYSYGYPMSAVSAHVSSCPNHQTLRVTPLSTRFNVAAFGVCGYECNLCDMKKEELDEIRSQIEIYKQWRRVLQYGRFYRGRNGNVHEWTAVSEDQTQAVGFVMHELVQANDPFEQYIPKGLDPEKKYHFANRKQSYNIKEFGDLINTVAPIHVKPDSVAHNLISKFVSMPGETEDAAAYGSAMMKSGIKLHQGYGATGYSEEIRYSRDFGSRIYFIKEEKG